ncbi:MAG TPA: HEPN domain-containing protein [Planctomycetaceae bacterium]|nr:HEPN domain-containing protein [Planctomycetaceae bacterium]
MRCVKGKSCTVPPPSTPPGPPGSARDWLDRARGKLAFAQVPLPPGGFLEDLCFFAQQAAELAIKAVYQHHGTVFRYTHDIELLLDELERQGITIPGPVRDADELTVYAAQARYPGLIGRVTNADWQQAL